MSPPSEHWQPILDGADAEHAVRFVERTVRELVATAPSLQLRATGGLARPLASVAASYVHMSLNRIFSHSQRQNELVVASLLERGYREVTARFPGPAAGSRPRRPGGGGRGR